MTPAELLTDAFERVRDSGTAVVDGLSEDELRHRPGPDANPIGWLVWHLTRVQDDHVADLIGTEQIYVAGDWAPRFGLKPDPSDTGYAHSPAQVAAVAPESAQVLEDYYRVVHDRTTGFLAGLAAEDFDRVVDTAWDPPVTLGVRLVSVFDDDAEHVGQAAYLRGLL
jgi:hypothetical protein